MMNHSNLVGGESAKRRKTGVGVMALLLLAAGMVGGGQSVSIAWDSSVSMDVAGYTVYRGTSSGVYTNVYDAGTNLALTLTSLPEGQTNYFKVVAYNSARMAGTPSAEISYIVPGIMRVSAPAKAGNPASLSFPVAAGHSYSVQATTNLVTWTTIYTTNSAAANTWVSYQDSQANSFSRRFYRLIMN